MATPPLRGMFLSTGLGAGLCLKGKGGVIGAVPERLQSGHRGCESGWGRRLLAVGNAVGAGVGVWECLWGRVSAVGRGEGGAPPPPPPFKRFPAWGCGRDADRGRRPFLSDPPNAPIWGPVARGLATACPCAQILSGMRSCRSPEKFAFWGDPDNKPIVPSENRLLVRWLLRSALLCTSVQRPGPCRTPSHVVCSGLASGSGAGAGPDVLQRTVCWALFVFCVLSVCYVVLLLLRPKNIGAPGGRSAQSNFRAGAPPKMISGRALRQK